MALTFKKAVSSNKKDLTQNFTPKDSPPLPGTPRPFIDRLTVNFTFNSAKHASETHAVIYQALANDAEFFLPVGKPVKGFKLAKQIALPKGGSYPRIDYAYDANTITGAKLANRIRLEFNPAKLGIGGLKSLHDFLGTLIAGGWATFVKHGRVSRLDVAVDLVGVRMTKLKVVPPKAVVSQTWSSSKGKLETYQWGKQKARTRRYITRRPRWLRMARRCRVLRSRASSAD
jgi:hypothetical protein